MPSLRDLIEQRLGLPKLEDITQLASGDTGKRIDSILSKLERLSRDSEGLRNAIELLNLVKDLDQRGSLVKLNELVKNLNSLLKSPIARRLSQNIDKVGELVEVLKKEE